MFKVTQWPITASIGAVSYTTPPGEVEELVRQADDAMYRAKAAGKNCIDLRIGLSPPPSVRGA
jgi:diguanylate cyclase (GGDEF)-like protein